MRVQELIGDAYEFHRRSSKGDYQVTTALQPRFKGKDVSWHQIRSICTFYGAYQVPEKVQWLFDEVYRAVPLNYHHVVSTECEDFALRFQV